MKVLVNGGLNLSEIDGWWAEAYRPDVGWALGDGQEHGDDPEWDAAEANVLYECLEQRVIPEYYARDARQRPVAWLARIRERMARLTPRFAATRAVRDYTEQHYLPAAAAYAARAAEGGLEAAKLVARQHAWREGCDALRILTVEITTKGEHHTVLARIALGELAPASLRVEVYANAHDGGPPYRQEMERVIEDLAAGSMVPGEYRATVPGLRQANDYTVRVTHREAGLRVPLEDNWILWHK